MISLLSHLAARMTNLGLPNVSHLANGAGACCLEIFYVRLDGKLFLLETDKRFLSQSAAIFVVLVICPPLPSARMRPEDPSESN
jgi:hypothetical protein